MKRNPRCRRSGEFAAWHEAGHAIVGAHFGLRVRRIHIDPPRGLTVFWQDRCFLRLAPRRHCLMSMAGQAAEAKILGRPLVPPVTKICDAMQRLRLGETLPGSDISNVARALAVETSDDLLALDLLALRTRDIQQLLDRDDIWARIEAVAAALVVTGQLSGPEVEALVSDADQQPFRRLYSEVAVPPG